MPNISISMPPPLEEANILGNNSVGIQDISYTNQAYMELEYQRTIQKIQDAAMYQQLIDQIDLNRPVLHSTVRRIYFVDVKSREKKISDGLEFKLKSLNFGLANVLLD